MTSTESKLLDILHAARYPTASSLPWHIEKYNLLERIMELFADKIAVLEARIDEAERYANEAGRAAYESGCETGYLQAREDAGYDDEH